MNRNCTRLVGSYPNTFLCKKMLAEYDVEESVARNHIDAFIKKLEESGFLE